MKRITRILLISAGTGMVILGVAGMFLPLLPTTPFLLLAAICYSRSSRFFHNWLITNRWCGSYIGNYREGKGIPLKQKVVTILLLWSTIGLTSWLAVSRWWLRLILFIIAVGVTIHLITIKTFRPDGDDPELSAGCNDSRNIW